MVIDKGGMSSFEMDVFKKLQNAFNQFGFTVNNEPQKVKGQTKIDFIIQNNSNYKIGVELKSLMYLHNGIRNGINQLENADKIYSFDKLLLLIGNQHENIPDNRKFLESIAAQYPFFQDNPTKLEVRLISQIDEWIETLISYKNQDNPTEKKFKLIVKECCKIFIRDIARNPEMLRELEWLDLERTVAELMEKLGFDVTLTRPSKDGGKDIILKCSIEGITKSYIIELKHWKCSTKVGKKDIKKFTEIIVKEKYDKGLFLSTYGFTSNYCEYLTESEEKIIQFGEKEKIVDLCKAYERIDNGVWLPINLEETLFEKTIKLYD